MQAQSGTDPHSSPSRLTCVSFPGSCPFPDTDLNAVIQKGKLLKDIHKRCIFYQLLRATKFIHSGRVIHRDQKVGSTLCPQVPGFPENLAHGGLKSIPLSSQPMFYWILLAG